MSSASGRRRCSSGRMAASRRLMSTSTAGRSGSRQTGSERSTLRVRGASMNATGLAAAGGVLLALGSALLYAIYIPSIGRLQQGVEPAAASASLGAAVPSTACSAVRDWVSMVLIDPTLGPTRTAVCSRWTSMLSPFGG